MNAANFGRTAFNGCTAMETLTLKGSVCPSIPSDNLTEIRLYSTTPIAAANFSDMVYDNATLYVPIGSLSLYQTAEGWGRFKNIEEFDSAGIKGTAIDKADAPIYNMQGGRVNGTLRTLPTGIYTQGGKKFMVM